MDPGTQSTLQAHKNQIDALAAETLALQFVLTALLGHLRNRPETRGLVDQSFSDAADLVEHFSLSEGERSGHAPQALNIIEQLRIAAAGKSDPKHGV